MMPKITYIEATAAHDDIPPSVYEIDQVQLHQLRDCGMLWGANIPRHPDPQDWEPWRVCVSEPGFETRARREAGLLVGQPIQTGVEGAAFRNDSCAIQLCMLAPAVFGDS